MNGEINETEIMTGFNMRIMNDGNSCVDVFQRSVTQVTF